MCAKAIYLISFNIFAPLLDKIINYNIFYIFSFKLQVVRL